MSSNRPAIITMKKHSEIVMLFNIGKWFHGNSISLIVKDFFLYRSPFECHFLISTKRIKKKPERNRLKRRIREQVRNMLTSIIESNIYNKKGKNIAIIASNSQISFTELGNTLQSLLKRAQILPNDNKNARTI